MPSTKPKRSQMENLVLLIVSVLIMGASTSASEALSSSSVSSSNGKTAFTKHTSFGHFQEQATASASINANNNNGNPGDAAAAASTTNGKANGNMASSNGQGKVNGNFNSNGAVPGPNNSNNNGSSSNKNGFKFEPDHIVPADYVADTKLPTDVGQFQLRAYRVRHADDDESEPYQNTNALEPVVIYSSDKPPFGKDGKLAENVPVRIHDQCLTSEVFRSRRCDCKEQLKLALEFVNENGGAVIYLQQEGRGIGLANKVAAYELQDMGMDTVDANLHLGFPEDCRKYGVVPSILKDMGIGSIQLMTNNPRKVERLEALGVSIVDKIPILVKVNPDNRKYLETKRERMNHSNFGHILSGDSLPPNGISNNGAMAPRRSAQTEGVTDAANAVANSLEDEEQLTADNSQAGVVASDDGYCFGRQSVEDGIAAVARGEMIVVVDDMDRENEGDFIMAADSCSPLDMAKIVRYSSGVICVGMEGERMDALKLPAMVTNSEDPKGTAFSVSVDASPEHGITTGISAGDRSTTVKMLANMDATPTDFNRPGHLFPLRAREGGVLTRDGHTEAAVDFSRLAGRSPCGVLCEIVSEENPAEMMRLPEIKRFCRQHGYVLTSIVDLAQYRRDTQQ